MWRVRVTIVVMETQHCVLCVVEEHVTLSYIKILSVDTKMFLWRICVASSNTAYLDLLVKCPVFLSYFKQIRSFSRNFRESHRFQIFTEIWPLGAVRIDGETDGRTMT